MLKRTIAGLLVLYVVNVFVAVSGGLSPADLLPFARGRLTTYEVGLVLVLALFAHAVSRFDLEPMDLVRDVWGSIRDVIGQGRNALAGNWVVEAALLFVAQFTLIPLALCATSPFWRSFAAMPFDFRRLSIVVLVLGSFLVACAVHKRAGPGYPTRPFNMPPQGP